MDDKKVQSILLKVAMLYHRYGIKSVTMDDVASHLSVSKKTLYEYFCDKRDLVTKVLESEHDLKCKVFDAIRDRNLNAIEEMFEIYKFLIKILKDHNPSMEYDIRKYYPDVYILQREKKRKTMFDNSYSNIVKGQKEGLYRQDINASLIARFHLFRIENVNENELFSSEELGSFETFHELFVYHLYGIVSDKGRSFFDNNFSRFSKRID